MGIYRVETDGSLIESRSTDAVLTEQQEMDNILEGEAAIIDDFGSDELMYLTFGSLTYGAIYYHSIENDDASDLVPIQGETVGG